MSRNPEVRLRLPAEIIEAIQSRPDCPPDRPGKTGGVSLWVKRLIEREVGGLTLDPHEEQARRFAKP